VSAADELRALTDAATPGPWRESGGYVWSNEHPARVALACSDADAALIVWLVNHAQAIADLIDAADALVQPAGWWKGVEQRQEHQLLDRRAVVRDALAALGADR